MDTTIKDEQIFIGNGDSRVELIGKARDEFIADREKRLAESAEQMAKTLSKRLAAEAKLTALGLTPEDLQVLGLSKPIIEESLEA
jgi:hypothetical protein